MWGPACYIFYSRVNVCGGLIGGFIGSLISVVM